MIWYDTHRKASSRGTKAYLATFEDHGRNEKI